MQIFAVLRSSGLVVRQAILVDQRRPAIRTTCKTLSLTSTQSVSRRYLQHLKVLNSPTCMKQTHNYYFLSTVPSLKWHGSVVAYYSWQMMIELSFTLKIPHPENFSEKKEGKQQFLLATWRVSCKLAAFRLPTMDGKILMILADFAGLMVWDTQFPV